MKNIIILPVILFGLYGFSQEKKEINYGELMTECTKMSVDAGHNKMVLWFPYDYWDAIAKQPGMPKAYVQMIKEEMKNYLMFCLADYTNRLSVIKFRTEEEIRKTIRITDTAGNVLKPIDPEDMPLRVKEMVTSFQPAFEKLLGQFGEGMRIFIFEVDQKDDKPVLDIYSKGGFTLSWEGASFSWKLPLAAVLAPKYCPLDKEEMKGNWNYCPLHGVKLD